MSSLGLGVMLHRLGGGNEDAPDLVKNALGKKITHAELEGDGLVLKFEGGTGIRISDKGQSCCEHRYMDTDDNLSDLVGDELRDILVSDGPDQKDEYGAAHEVQFLRVFTNNNVAVVQTHNEHNGYYGGFALDVDEVKE